ncbi:mannosyltransferase [Microbacterium sp. cf046]|uniref:hypothetical protein n=1 Tax=Microbacterium sp. cf046 TaxID=1761803 RepID=UPI0008F04A2F|nr:hypothetical protein [Microbacterium sp. cf046]SFR91080.1 mannosyltransferase [Microbacterium sp. cf046]
MTSLKTNEAGSASRTTFALMPALTIGLPAILALLLGVSRSLTVPLWRDEYATSMHAALAPSDLVRSLAGGDAVQGAYYLLIRLLSSVVGVEIGMRIPSLLAFAVTAATVSAIALRWWGIRSGLAAGIFFALNGAAITAGATARPYALTLMFLALAVFAADRADRGRRWNWIGYCAAAVLAVAMHVISIVALLCIGVLALGRHRGWLLRWVSWTAPALAVGVALALIGDSQQSQIAWLPAPGLRSGISGLAQAAGVSVYRAVVWDGLGLIVLAAAAAAAMLVTAGSAGRSARAGGVRPVLFAAALAFAAPVALFALSWIVMPAYTARYLSWASLGAALIVGAAVFAATARDRIPSVVAGACAAILLAGAAWIAALQLAQPPGVYDDVPALVGDLDQSARPGDALAVIQRNPHSGVAYALARTAKDDAWAADIVDRLPASAQPTVELRSVAGTEPIELEESPGAVPAEGATVWIVSLDAPSDAELAAIGDGLGCTTDAADADPEFFGGMRLYEVPCG